MALGLGLEPGLGLGLGQGGLGGTWKLNGTMDEVGVGLP